MRLDPRIADECRLGLFRFRQAVIGVAGQRHAKRRQQIGHFFQLALVMGRDQQTVARKPAHQRTAASCRAVSSATPFSATIQT